MKIHKRNVTVVFILVFGLIFLTEYFLIEDHLQDTGLEKSFDSGCYRVMTETLPDLSFSPPTDRSIFFLDTSCTSFERGKITITARQACAVESAAILNPHYEVFLLYSSPGVFKDEGDESDDFLKALMSYENVNLNYVDFKATVNGTPAQELYNSGQLSSSYYFVEHASDILRLVILWKYGGIYLDTDIIVIKSLSELSMNFAGLQSESEVNSAVMSFSARGFGHDLVDTCLTIQKDNFDGSQWTHNGPEILTRVLTFICGVHLAIDMVDAPCQGFTVYPPDYFYPFPYQDWKTFFNASFLHDFINKTEDSYAIHAWNKLSKYEKIPVTSSSVPYLYFAKKFCPKIASKVRDFF